MIGYLRRKLALWQMHRRINAAEAVHGPAVDRILDARDRLEVMAEERRNSPAIRQYVKRRAAAIKNRPPRPPRVSRRA